MPQRHLINIVYWQYPNRSLYVLHHAITVLSGNINTGVVDKTTRSLVASTKTSFVARLMIEVFRSQGMAPVGNGSHIVRSNDVMDIPSIYRTQSLRLKTVRPTLIVIPVRYFDCTKRRILISMTITVILLGIERGQLRRGVNSGICQSAQPDRYCRAHSVRLCQMSLQTCDQVTS